MKLRNKKTGETVKFSGFGVTVVGEDGRTRNEIFDSLARLNEEWEDMPKPKTYYYVDCDGEIQKTVYEECSFDKSCEEIGNRFETEEEAEKAVEKLKAWKRLEDMGFKIEGIRYRNNKNYIEWSIYQKVKNEHFASETFNTALHLLFGGEE